MTRRTSTLAALLLLAAAGTNCSCPGMYADQADRREASLRDWFPTGTSRLEVQERWHEGTPCASIRRPEGGWAACADGFVAPAAEEAERASGAEVALVEGHRGPAGWGDECHCWFFYDARMRVLDARWEWQPR